MILKVTISPLTDGVKGEERPSNSSQGTLKRALKQRRSQPEKKYERSVKIDVPGEDTLEGNQQQSNLV